jgi:uncharacterized protein (TIGR00369 family)
MDEVQNPDYRALVAASFARQGIMGLIGARLGAVEPGVVEIALTPAPQLSQQHGFVHAGVVTTIVDSACGYAALTLAPPGCAVLTAEYKVNFVAPAAGNLLLARGAVKKAGRTVTVCAGDVFAVTGERRKLVATMLATIMVISGRPDLTHA